MTRSPCFVPLLALAVLVPAPAAAAGPAPESGAAGPPTSALQMFDPMTASGPPLPGAVVLRLPAARQRALLHDIRSRLDVERDALGALHLQFTRARTEHEALAVQREIERVHGETEVAILRLQIAHARSAGLRGLANLHEHSLSGHESPPPSGLRLPARSTSAAAAPR